MIDKAKCLELCLPAPKIKQFETSYVIACMAADYPLNTWICRYIGIGNLHSILSALNNRKDPPPFTIEHGKAWCPNRKLVPNKAVDIAYMTPEQRKQYASNKKPAKA
ncbi:MAG: hypothetical protein RPS47_04020 [Colwellia sp.]|jgi:hypothetical protein